MRRLLIGFIASALAALALGGAAFAKPGDATVELTVTPTDPKIGDSVLVQAYVHFETEPYQNANVEFVITGPGIKQGLTLHGKPSKPGIYTNQFTAQGVGDYQIVTRVDGIAVMPKPYHLQVSGTAVSAGTDWLPLAAGAGALALLGIAGAFLMRRGRFARTIPATN
jgi:hypothetical protein